MITLLVVSRARLYSEGMVSALGNADTVCVTGSSSDPPDAIVRARETQPDVAILDMSMPAAFDLLARLREASPRTKIIAFAVDEAPEVVACLEAGACGYVTCEASIPGLIATIESVARDEMPCSPRMAAAFARRLATRVSPRLAVEAGPPLTARQRQVLRLMCEGMSNKEIGVALHISEATVKNHVHHLLGRLNVTSRSHAVQRVTAERTLESFALRDF